MPDPAAFNAEIIQSSARVIAAEAAERLLADRPQAHAFGTPPFQAWHEHITARLIELAAAMRAGEPDLFRARLAWARAAFESRGLNPDELAASLTAIEQALADQLPPGGPDAARPYLDAAAAALNGDPAHHTPEIVGRHGDTAARYLLALLEGDRRAATDVITDACDAGLSPRDAMLGVLIPVEREVGRMWHLGEIAIGEEHFVTATANLVLGTLRTRLPMAEPNGRSVLIASVIGNSHELAGRVAGLLLESAGWRVIDLGSETPAPDLVRAAADFRVDLIVLGAMLSTQAEAARRAIAAIRADADTASIPVIVGGHVFDEAPDLWKKIDADAHARTLAGIVELASATTRAG